MKKALALLTAALFLVGWPTHAQNATGIASMNTQAPFLAAALSQFFSDTRAFTAAIRQRIFSFLRGLANGEPEVALAGLDSPLDADGQPWTAERLQQVLTAYHTDHQRICLDPEARNLRHTYVIPGEDRKAWRVQQMLVDPDGHNDWAAEFSVDLSGSRQAGQPVMSLHRLALLQ